MLAAVVTAVAVTLTPTLEGGCVVASGNAAATVMADRSVASGRIDADDPAAYQQMMQHSACWEKGWQ